MNAAAFWRDEVRPRLTVDAAFPGVSWHHQKGREWRAPCVIHGGDNPTAFAVDVESLLWRCYRCGASGDVLAFLNGGESPRGARFLEVVRRAAELAGVDVVSLDGTGAGQRRQAARRAVPPPPNPLAQPTPVRDDLETLLRHYQEDLDHPYAVRYLEIRRIPLEVARAAGVGYARPGVWPGRPWKWGRMVVPHTDPRGIVINLSGRACGDDGQVPKDRRHDHLTPEVAPQKGPKKPSTGHFNARAYAVGEGPLLVCEGPFDALAAIAAGHPRSVCVFGVENWRWDWSRRVQDVWLGFDRDKAGEAHAAAIIAEGRLRGRRITSLPLEAYGGHKDLNAAWCGGGLVLGEAVEDGAV